MRTEQALLVSAFGFVVFAPLIPAFLHLMGNDGGAVLDVPPDRDDDPRHFPKRLKKLIDEAHPDLLTGPASTPSASSAAIHTPTPAHSGQDTPGRFLVATEPGFFDRQQRVERRRLLSAFQKAEPAESRIAIVSELPAVPAGARWLGDTYTTRNVEIQSGAVLRTLLCEGHCLLHPQATVLRWVDAQSLYVMGPVTLPPRTTATRKISLSTAIEFERLVAPLIEILNTGDHTDSHPQPPMPVVPDIEVWRLQADDESTMNRKIFDEDVLLGEAIDCGFDLICHGDLHIGKNCRIGGHVKVYGTLYVHERVTIDGNVFCEGNAIFSPHCKVTGIVSCLGHLDVGTDCTLGLPDQLTTVVADTITLRSGTCTHGQIWARSQGETHA